MSIINLVISEYGVTPAQRLGDLWEFAMMHRPDECTGVFQIATLYPVLRFRGDNVKLLESLCYDPKGRRLVDLTTEALMIFIQDALPIHGSEFKDCEECGGLAFWGTPT